MGVDNRADRVARQEIHPVKSASHSNIAGTRAVSTLGSRSQAQGHQSLGPDTQSGRRILRIRQGAGTGPAGSCHRNLGREPAGLSVGSTTAIFMDVSIEQGIRRYRRLVRVAVVPGHRPGFSLLRPALRSIARLVDSFTAFPPRPGTAPANARATLQPLLVHKMLPGATSMYGACLRRTRGARCPRRAMPSAGQPAVSNITASQNPIMSARNWRDWSPSLPIRAPRRP